MIFLTEKKITFFFTWCKKIVTVMLDCTVKKFLFSLIQNLALEINFSWFNLFKKRRKWLSY